MKKALIIALLGFAFYSNAQETEVNDFKKNEIKLNMFYFVLGATEVSYERNLNDDSSVGISFLLPTSKEARMDINYVVTPYYRLFFGNKPAQGFFLEGFGMLNSTERYTYYYIHDNYNGSYYHPNHEVKTITDFALGVAVGGKFVLKEKLVAEVNGGIGRNLFPPDDDNYYYSSIVPRFSIGVGYRF